MRPGLYCHLSDQRDVRQVIWYEEPGHEPLEPENTATILEFRQRT